MCSKARRPLGVEREREMLRLRTVDGLTLGAIAARFGVGPERVRQLINRHVRETTGRPPNAAGLSQAAKATRRAASVVRAQDHAQELIAAWRDGEDPQRLARTFDLRVRCVTEVIRTNATDADRAARRAAAACARLSLARTVGLGRRPAPSVALAMIGKSDRAADFSAAGSALIASYPKPSGRDGCYEHPPRPLAPKTAPSMPRLP